MQILWWTWSKCTDISGSVSLHIAVFLLFFFLQRHKQQIELMESKAAKKEKKKNTWNSFQFELIWINDFCCKRYAWSKWQKRLTRLISAKCVSMNYELLDANRKSIGMEMLNFFLLFPIHWLRIDGLILSSFAVAISSSILLQFAIRNRFNYNVKAWKTRCKFSFSWHFADLDSIPFGVCHCKNRTKKNLKVIFNWSHNRFDYGLQQSKTMATTTKKET